jgi:diguanylate cyclase (GGDEF)-like protein
MAIAATPITRSRDLLDLLRQIVPPQEKAVEIYRRLLAINELSGSMNVARSVDSLRRLLAAYFLEYLPSDAVRLCILDGARYRRVRLSGPEVPASESVIPLTNGVAGSVIKSKTPVWIPDTHPARKSRRFAGVASDTLARSLVVIPFTAMKRVVGCLEMISNRPNRFDEIEYHLGLLVASHLSSALENILTRRELATANARLKDHDVRLTQLNEKLQQLAHTDEGTGLFNKRRLFERLDMEVARARRYGEILSCLMIDIDDFKQINDTHGHQAGDQVLRQVGALLQRSLRVTDFIARYGGEEFTVLLPRTNSAGAYRVAENLRSIFMSHEFVLPAKRVHLTISIGVACCTRFDLLDSQQVIRLADNALYRAKRGGKNQACYADENELPAEEVRILSNGETGLTHRQTDRAVCSSAGN